MARKTKDQGEMTKHEGSSAEAHAVTAEAAKAVLFGGLVLESGTREGHENKVEATALPVAVLARLLKFGYADSHARVAWKLGAKPKREDADTDEDHARALQTYIAAVHARRDEHDQELLSGVFPEGARGGGREGKTAVEELVDNVVFAELTKFAEGLVVRQSHPKGKKTLPKRGTAEYTAFAKIWKDKYGAVIKAEVEAEMQGAEAAGETTVDEDAIMASAGVMPEKPEGMSDEDWKKSSEWKAYAKRLAEARAAATMGDI